MKYDFYCTRFNASVMVMLKLGVAEALDRVAL